MEFTPENTVFLLLSFEGPDPYAQAGGLGVRATGLARALSARGFPVHFFFVGDPSLPGMERTGTLHLYRWAQWISRYHPGGVYAAEVEKMHDLERSLPWYVVEHIARQTATEGKWLVILAEEWHMTTTVMALSDLLYREGLRSRALILWNANHRMGLNKIDFARLGYVATLTTVSRFMKHLFWGYGLNPVVIPNGIGSEWLEPMPAEDVQRLRKVPGRPLLVKVGRFDPDKRWLMAIEAVAQLKAEGYRPTLIMRGGMEPHGGEVLGRARALGLSVVEVTLGGTPDLEAALAAVESAPEGDILHLRFFVPQALLMRLYQAADAVLVNSGFEPFGLVGLEVMACEGVAITGATGEDYARSFENSLVVESDEAAEVAAHVRYLLAHPQKARAIAAEGRKTAETYVWDRVIDELVFRLDLVRRKQTGEG